MTEEALEKILGKFSTRLIEVEKRIQGLSPAAPINEEKPPLGVKPKRIHNLIRQAELAEAIGRYIDVGKKIPIEWVEEYNFLNDYKNISNCL